MALTKKQEAFAVAVAKGEPASDAYKRAYDAKGMSPNAICVEASRLQANPKVALRIKSLAAPAFKRHEASVDRLLDETLGMALGLPDEPLTYAAKLKALDMLFRNRGLYREDNAQTQPNLSLRINIVGGPPREAEPIDVTPSELTDQPRRMD